MLSIIADPDDSSYKIWVGSDNYQIWQVFIARGSAKSIRPLYDIVSNLSKPYLVRYHACTALFAIAGIKDDEFKGMVQYGRNAARELIDQQAAIHRLEAMLNGLGV